MTYLVHGETAAQEALKARISDELGWNVEIPAYGEGRRGVVDRERH